MIRFYPTFRARITVGMKEFEDSVCAICSIIYLRTISARETVVGVGSNMRLQYGSSKLCMAVYSLFPMRMLGILPSFTALLISFSPMPIAGRLCFSSVAASLMVRICGRLQFPSKPRRRLRVGAIASASATMRLPW